MKQFNCRKYFYKKKETEISIGWMDWKSEAVKWTKKTLLAMRQTRVILHN